MRYNFHCHCSVANTVADTFGNTPNIYKIIDDTNSAHNQMRLPLFNLISSRLIEGMKRDAAKRVAVVMATQPLYVVAVRSMAQFVGGERKYNGLLAPFKEILQENGIIGGFYRNIQVNATNGRLERKLWRIDIVLICLEWPWWQDESLPLILSNNKSGIQALALVKSFNISPILYCRFLVWVAAARHRRRPAGDADVGDHLRGEQVPRARPRDGKVHRTRRRVHHLLHRLPVHRRLKHHRRLQVRFFLVVVQLSWTFIDL